MMKTILTTLLLAGICASRGVLAQPEVVCGSLYEVQPGDSLSIIAGTVYGRTSAYQPIFDFNPGVLEDPNVIQAGVELYIPCIDSPAPSSGTLPELPAARSGDLKILTGSKYPPYVGDELPNGGFSTELVERALLSGGGSSNFRIDVIDDWSSHLALLLADGAYDLAYPWFEPDCSVRDKLGEASLWRCDNLLFSEPMHDVVVTFYAKPKMAARVSSPKDLKGSRLCRPRGYFTFDLEAEGLSPPFIDHVVPDDAEDCFRLLADGKVDVVSVNADTSDRMLTALDLRGKLEEIIDLATVHSLRVVAMKDDPNARVNLLRVNQGLRKLRSDGTFRQVARVHLRE